MPTARFKTLVLGTGLTGTDNADNTITIDATAGGGGVTELAYVEQTSDVTCNQTAEASAVQIVSAGALSFDGSTRVLIEFFCGRLGLSGAGSAVAHIALFDGSSSVGRWGKYGLSSLETGCYLQRFLTPSNASHTYSARGFYEQGAFIAYGGAGGSGVQLPTFIRITEA